MLGCRVRPPSIILSWARRALDTCLTLNTNREALSVLTEGRTLNIVGARALSLVACESTLTTSAATVQVTLDRALGAHVGRLSLLSDR